MMNNDSLNTAEIRRVSLCKCGSKAEFIKDYLITETKSLNEGDADQSAKRNVENVCGVLRRRFCPKCLSKIAYNQKKFNKRLNVKIFFAVVLPLVFFAILSLTSYVLFKDNSALVTAAVFFGLSVVVGVVVLVILSVAQRKRGKIARGDYSNLKAVDALLDSLNFGLEDAKRVKDIPSTDVVVDGDGRVNYEMERSGFAMRVLFNGKMVLEPMRQRIIYPFKGDSEYLKRTYTHARLLEENIKIFEERELTEKDFDIRNGELRRYSGLSINVVIPDGVTKICVQAFKKSRNCETIVLPQGVTDIEKEAFAYCPAATVVLPEGVKKISSFCFYASAITEIKLPESIQSIDDNAFGECYNLEKIVIPSSCKRVGEAAFKNCAALCEVELCEGIEVICDYAFNGCKNLTKIEIPDGCYEIGNFAFEGCTNLREVYLPETIQFVGGRVFEGAKQMSIYGKPGSYAEKFANEYRLRFTAKTESRFKKHDIYIKTGR